MEEPPPANHRLLSVANKVCSTLELFNYISRCNVMLNQLLIGLLHARHSLSTCHYLDPHISTGALAGGCYCLPVCDNGAEKNMNKLGKIVDYFQR